MTSLQLGAVSPDSDGGDSPAPHRDHDTGHRARSKELSESVGDTHGLDFSSLSGSAVLTPSQKTSIAAAQYTRMRVRAKERRAAEAAKNAQNFEWRLAKQAKALGRPDSASTLATDKTWDTLPHTRTLPNGNQEVLPLLTLAFRYIIDQVVIKRNQMRKYGLTVRNIVNTMNPYLQRKFLSELMSFGVLTSYKLRRHLVANNWIMDVRALDLPNFDLNAADLSLILYVTQYARYRSVDLRDNPISGPQITYIGPIIAKKWLLRLNLSDTRVCAPGAQVLAAALPDTSIQFLSLRNSNLGLANFKHDTVEYDGYGIVLLLKALVKQETLVFLDISNNSLFGVRWEEAAGTFIGDLYHPAVKAFAQLLYKNRSLAYVLSRCNAVGGFYDPRTELIEAGVQARYLLRGLARNATAVSILDISKSGLRYTGADALSDMLMTNRTLTKLDLSTNTMGFLGFQTLARALYTQPTLTWLNLQSNKGRDEGVAVLAEALEYNDTLTHLDLSYNDIREAGAVALTRMVDANKALEELCLQVNRFGPMGAFPLLESIGYHRTLRVVDISASYLYADQRFDPDLVKKNRYVDQALVRMATETNTITHLDLRRNYIPYDTSKKMRPRLEGCEFLV